MIAYLKATDWNFILHMLLITVGPLLVIGLPILIMGAAPIDVWIVTGLVTAVIIAMVFGIEKMGR